VSVVLAQVIQVHINQTFDWVTSILVPLGAALIGGAAAFAGATWQVRSSTQQMTRQLDSARDSLKAQLDAERELAREERETNRRDRQAEREEDRKAVLLDLLEAARVELRANVEMTKQGQADAGYGWTPMSTEFTHRLLVSNRLGTGAGVLTAAFLAGQRYSTAASFVNAGGATREAARQSMQRLANEASGAMESAIATLNRQIVVFPVDDLPLVSNEPSEGP
jgi:hypothetical protein